MKSLLVTVLGILALSAAATFSSHADIQGAPFIPEIDKRFDAIEQGNHYKTGAYPSGASDGHYSRQLAQATYNFSTLTGALGTYDLKVSIPQNATITRSWLYSVVKPTTSASGTLEFFCQNSGDILAATAASSYAIAGSARDGTSTGSTATFQYIKGGKCDVQAKIATGALTLGKVTAYIEYVVSQ